jgi:hypothetical protein
MSKTNDSRPEPVLRVLLQRMNVQPSRRPYIVLRRAEGHYRELLVFLYEKARGAREANQTATTACQAGFASNKITLVASSVAELDAVGDEAVKAETSDHLQALKTSLQQVRDLLNM